MPESPQPLTAPVEIDAPQTAKAADTAVLPGANTEGQPVDEGHLAIGVEGEGDSEALEPRTATVETGFWTRNRKIGAGVVAVVAMLVTAGANVAGLFRNGSGSVEATPGPVPTMTTSGLGTPEATQTPTTPVETATPTESAEPTESASTAETTGPKELSNENAIEVAPELAKIYDKIADKVEAGDLTYDEFLKLSEDEQALVQQSLVYRLTQHGAPLLDTSLCYPDDENVPGCNPDFASRDDSAKEIVGKGLLLASAPTTYTEDSANGQVSDLNMDAANILWGVDFVNPYDADAQSRFGGEGGTLDVLKKLVAKGRLVHYSTSSVEILKDTPSSNGNVRTIHFKQDKNVDNPNNPEITATNVYHLMRYTVDGKTASHVLGLDKKTTVELAQWKKFSESTTVG